MAHKKAGGSTKQHKQRPGKRLGVKVYAGEKIKTGGIIVRQQGSVMKPGAGVAMGRDFTLFAAKDGLVQFKKKFGKTFVYVA